MTVLNLTPHSIVVYDGDGINPVLTVPSDGVIRLSEITDYDSDVMMNNVTIPVVTKKYDKPKVELNKEIEFDDDLVVIVSSVVASNTTKEDIRAALDYLGPRILVLVPDTGPDSVVRDESGRIIGIRRFIKMS